MLQIIELSGAEARAHFLKSSSYFNGDFPKYISFEPILNDVAAILKGACFYGFKNGNDIANQLQLDR